MPIDQPYISGLFMVPALADQRRMQAFPDWPTLREILENPDCHAAARRVNRHRASERPAMNIVTPHRITTEGEGGDRSHCIRASGGRQGDTIDAAMSALAQKCHRYPSDWPARRNRS